MIKKKLTQILKEAIRKSGFKELKKKRVPMIEIESSPQIEFGDFSTNIALQIKKITKKPVQEIAKKIVANLFKPNFIAKVEIASPGFINFFIDKKWWAKQILKDILVRKEHYGENKIGKGKKVIIEHTSVNPNKAMHIGHLRNSCIGDTVARVLRKSGYSVEVENYIDDTGVQVADILLALKLLKRKQPKSQSFDYFCWDIYSEINRLYKKKPELLEKRKNLLQRLEKRDLFVSNYARNVAKKIIKAHLESCKNFNIFFDLLVWESDILEAGFWKHTFKTLKKKPNFILEDFGSRNGCWVIRTKDKKIPAKVLVKSDGTATYTAKDIAYHLWKFGVLGKDFKYKKFSDSVDDKKVWSSDMKKGRPKKGFGNVDKVVNVIDSSQRYPQLVLKLSLSELNYRKQAKNLRHLDYGVVSLSRATAEKLGVDTIEEKEFYPMSGRKGIGVKVNDLLNLITLKVKNRFKEKEQKEYEKIKKEKIKNKEIASAAIRYYLLKYDASKAIVFDIEKSIKILGDTGPYLQYSYARACGILRKSVKNNYKLPDLIVPSGLHNSTIELIRLLSYFPEVVEKCAKDLDVNSFTDYAFDLAQSFNYFYEEAEVLQAEKKNVKEFRLLLVFGFKQTMKNLLDILGIVAPKRI